MSLEKLKAELAAMPEEQQSQLAAYLVHLRHQRDPQFPAETSRQLESAPGQWISMDQLKEHWKGQ